MKKFILIALLISSAFSLPAQDKQQCKGTTVKGVQCKLKADISGYCHFHNPAALRCNGITGKGVRCKRIVKTTDGFCYQHKH